MHIQSFVVAVVVVLLSGVLAACEPTTCGDLEEDLSVALGHASMEGWEAIEAGSEVLVAPGSQGWGLMIEVNIRLTGLAADVGAYSTADVQIFRGTEEAAQLTAPGTRMLAALCQDDGALLSRNRRVEFSDDYTDFTMLEGIDLGIDALLAIDVELQDGRSVAQELQVNLIRAGMAGVL
ncbi:MAG: hypothetical protein CMP23_04715 [Rickettsiales bacterium]|nr:hypothetical protein [Rickettsiales bacterium]|tara:strand:- start:10 stop:546 length:537 start_codon:yes stop_codon:yes gene_type:complete